VPVQGCIGRRTTNGFVKRRYLFIKNITALVKTTMFPRQQVIKKSIINQASLVTGQTRLKQVASQLQRVKGAPAISISIARNFFKALLTEMVLKRLQQSIFCQGIA